MRRSRRISRGYKKHSPDSRKGRRQDNVPKTLQTAAITGIGMYVPERVMTNDELATIVETSDEWIVSRTGIRQRRIAAATEATSDLAVNAGRDALAVAGRTAEDLDLILVATCTGDYGSFPATAAVVQERLGAGRAAAFDVTAVCAGFAYALDVAAQYVETGRYRTVLVIGAEIMSGVVDWSDRNTCVLFGDGAGAVVVERAEREDQGAILGSILGTDGSGVQHLNIPAGGTRQPLTADLLDGHQNCIYQNGREVYKFAVKIIGEAAIQALETVGMTPADVNLFVPHQANIRIISAAAERMGLPMEKVMVNLDRYGNTSAASVPMALCEAWRAGRVKPGNIIVTVGFGAGLTWGANVIRWGSLSAGSPPAPNSGGARGEAGEGRSPGERIALASFPASPELGAGGL
ncbi:MAG: ketoacyl-ACP synthase III [Akkermansiaceae bacterium]|nr:ketoacyl-ACP synthase III [Armatimonadota bacterium]